MQPQTRNRTTSMTAKPVARPFNKRAATALREARRNMAKSQWKLAESNLLYASLQAPDDPEPYALGALVHRECGRLEDALDAYREALKRDPGNVDVGIGIVEVLQKLGRLQEARDALDALDAPGSAALPAADLFRCALVYDLTGRHAEALELANRVLQSEPGHEGAGLLRARSLSVLGAVEESASTYRAMIDAKRRAAAAWFGLVDLKTQALTDSDVEQMTDLLRVTPARSEDSTLLLHALGMAMERSGQLEQAFERFRMANEARSLASPWNREIQVARLRKTRQLFEACEPDTALRSGPEAATRGSEVIFIVGLPRSGTTLLEQILAAHPQVEGCGELPDLPSVLGDRSRRAGLSIEDWAGRATDADWEAAGKEYLERTSIWRQSKPRHVDKLPSNWTYGGFIHRMLPGATVVHILRDSLEACWSCYKQLFASGAVGYTCSFPALAEMCAMQQHFAGFWARRFPRQYGLLSYESLTRNAAQEIEGLLRFCGLDPDPQCLDFHRSSRAVRTPSSAQVRQPLGRPSENAGAYGALLDPLREALTQSQREWPVELDPGLFIPHGMNAEDSKQ